MQKLRSYNHVITLEKLKQFLPETTSLFEHTYINPLNEFKSQKFHTALKSLNEFCGIETYLPINKYRELYKTGIITDSAFKHTIASYNSRTVSDWMHLMLMKKIDSPNHNNNCFQNILLKHFNIDLKKSVHPKLFKIISSYLNQNLSGVMFPARGFDFFKALAIIEKDSLVSFFKSKSVRDLIFEKKLEIENILALLIGDEDLYENFLFEITFSHVGYSSLIVSIEKHPKRFIQNVEITLEDFIKLELLLILDELDSKHKNNWSVLSELFEDSTENFATENLLYYELLEVWQESLENSIVDSFVTKLANLTLTKRIENKLPAMQAVFCYEDVDLANSICSVNNKFRPYFYLGHLGLKFFYKVPTNGFNLTYASLDENVNHVLQGSLTNDNFLTGTNLKQVLYTFSKLISGRSKYYNPLEVIHFDVELPKVLQQDNRDINRKVGFTLSEIAQIIRRLIETLGIDLRYSDIIYLVGHSSNSGKVFNNFICSCECSSGKSNILNVRLFAKMANDSRVRNFLKADGFDLGTTYFIPVFHTHSNLTGLDYENLNDEVRSLHGSMCNFFNYKLHTKNNKNEAAKNNLSFSNIVYIGKFRPYLIEHVNYITYDECNDSNGDVLMNILEELIVFLINRSLTYYLSLTDGSSFSCGDEIATSIEGLLGVSNKHGGDLKIGLSEQQLKNRLPFRPLIVVEVEDENKVNKSINETPHLVEYAKNGWIHLKTNNIITKSISSWEYSVAQKEL